MKKVLFTLAALAAITAVMPVAEAQQRTVRIATEGAYPPWNSTDASGKLIGFEIDLAQDLCRRINATCTVVAQEWDGIIPSLQQGRYDAIMAGMSITPTRLETINFAGPYATDSTVFSALKSNPLAALPTGALIDMQEISAEEKAAIDALAAQLRGKAVGVQISTIQQNMLQQLMPSVTVRTYDATDNIFLDLAAGRIDAALVDRSATSAFIKSDQGGNVQIFGPNFARGVLGIGVGIGLRKADTQLKADFDKAIADATADGTMSRLSTQWFGYDISIKR